MEILMKLENLTMTHSNLILGQVKLTHEDASWEIPVRKYIPYHYACLHICTVV